MTHLHAPPHARAQEKGIRVLEGRAVAAVEEGRLLMEGAPPEAFDECLWCTQACAPAWLGGTGLPLGALFLHLMLSLLYSVRHEHNQNDLLLSFLLSRLL